MRCSRDCIWLPIVQEDHEDEKIIEENAENDSVETEYSKEETEEAFETSTFKAELNSEDTGMY